MSLKYTNIQHDFRKQNNLSLNEYVICDMIFFLCKKSDSKVPQWCFMSKETMGKEMGLSKQSIITLIKKMCDFGFLEKQEITGFVKTTFLWEKVYFTDGKDSLPSVNKVDEIGKESLPHDGKESLPHNNNIYNNNKETNFLFKNSFWNSYENLKNLLKEDSEFIKNYGAVDLKHYIFQVDAWSESVQKKRTERGWLMTLKKWMNTDLLENKLIKLPTNPNKPIGHINH
jgi:DNA-binding transcriptional regulator GbsR (MarR family)